MNNRGVTFKVRIEVVVEDADDSYNGIAVCERQFTYRDADGEANFGWCAGSAAAEAFLGVGDHLVDAPAQREQFARACLSHYEGNE